MREMVSDLMQLDLEQLRNCFAEARSERDQLEESIERSLENIQALQRRLCHWQIELCDSRDELKGEQARLAREAEEARRREQAQSAEINRLEQELAGARDALSRQTSTEEQFETLNQQQQDEMRRLREEYDKLKHLQNETLQELSAERQTSHDLRAALEAAHEGITVELEARLKVINDELASTRGDLNQRNEVVHGLEQERTALETELELVRARAAELTDALDRERKQMAEDRAEWSSELKQLRRLLERQARLTANPSAIVDLHAAPAAEADDIRPINGSKTPRRDDPVVGSVLAQFDRIRQQRVAARAAN
jgi:chromosome segregation ATPase